MKMNKLLVVTLALVLGMPLIAEGKDKKKPSPRGMIESMQALPCGVKQKGLQGLGSLWASVGVTSVNSKENLCPQYLLRTDELEYHIRPVDTKHAVILPIGKEAEYKIKKDRLFLKVPDGDRKARAYQVVSMEPVNSSSMREGAASMPEGETSRPALRSTEPRPADTQAQQVNHTTPPPQ